MGSPRLAEALLTLLVAALALPPAAFAQQGGGRAIFCCDDANGRPVCGDMLPAACYGRAYREISPQGSVRRHVAAPLTREEVARRDAAERQRKEEEARLMQQRRLDQALLETYSSLEDIDDRQDRALAEVERSLHEVYARQAELREQRKRYEEEAKFYEGRDLPRALESSLRNIDSELATYKGVVESKQREMDAIRARYAQDRRRYAELIASGEARR